MTPLAIGLYLGGFLFGMIIGYALGKFHGGMNKDE
jgi:hypothetical protein